MPMNTDIQIPELSFKSIEEGDSESISLLDIALKNHGFFSITDHGLSEHTLNQCYQSSKDFFNLPEETKKKYHNPSLKGARGYTPFGIETAVGESVADLKEFWHHGPVIDDTYSLQIST